MENKLQQLTQKLYNEGLSKGQQESEQLISKAKAEAALIVSNAKKEAAQIIEAAQKSASEFKQNTETELAMAGRQALVTLKSQIERLIILKGVTPAVSAANADAEFVKNMLLTVAKNWNASADSVNLSIVLPEQQKAEFAKLIEMSAQKTLGEGLEISFDNKVKSGFKIGPRDGGYYISFSDADFDALIKEFLRPQVSKMLFSQE